jgi:tRNA dimethylallyltransferase
VGWRARLAELAPIDPVTAARLAPLDAQRIQRALEVWQLSGQPLSALHGQPRTPGLLLPMLSLEPQSRGWLHAHIARRFDTMLGAGLVDEVRTLRQRGDLHAGLPAMRCVGYRQVWAALDADDAPLQPDDPRWSAMREAGIVATRQLAKRQLTWLRSMDRHVVAADAPDVLAQALAQLARLVDRPTPA